ncbi:MAG: VacJ family lipoprotein [Steroidobacteraceae bacterium]|jgi:phospholipid-binding lipoprotein MlaA
MRATLRVLLAALVLSFVSGCATQPGARSDPRDPWERMNRVTFRFNDKLDRAVLKPVARGYRRVTPHFVQVGVSNFLNNVSYPTVMVNELLQGRFTPFVRDTGRLLINTTIGIGGLFDPATPMGFEKNDRDLGQTLGVWGVNSGPYLVIPLLGPSDVRDGVGRVGDVFSDPRSYIRNDYWSYGLWAVGFIDTRAHLLDVEGALEGAYDPYAFIRNAYLQNRGFKVRGGSSHAEEDEEKKMLEESGVDSSPPAPAPPEAPPPETPPATPPK